MQLRQRALGCVVAATLFSVLHCESIHELEDEDASCQQSARSTGTSRKDTKFSFLQVNATNPDGLKVSFAGKDRVAQLEENSSLVASKANAAGNGTREGLHHKRTETLPIGSIKRPEHHAAHHSQAFAFTQLVQRLAKRLETAVDIRLVQRFPDDFPWVTFLIVLNVLVVLCCCLCFFCNPALRDSLFNSHERRTASTGTYNNNGQYGTSERAKDMAPVHSEGDDCCDDAQRATRNRRYKDNYYRDNDRTRNPPLFTNRTVPARDVRGTDFWGGQPDYNNRL